MVSSRGIQGHGRGVHGPRCLPSHLPHLGKAVESRHIPIEFLHTFHGDVDACTTVAVVLMPARPTLEPLLVAVRTLRMSTHWTPLTRVLGVNPRSRNLLERRLVRRIVLEGAEREVVQASVHPRAVCDCGTARGSGADRSAGTRSLTVPGGMSLVREGSGARRALEGGVPLTTR